MLTLKWNLFFSPANNYAQDRELALDFRKITFLPFRVGDLHLCLEQVLTVRWGSCKHQWWFSVHNHVHFDKLLLKILIWEHGELDSAVVALCPKASFVYVVTLLIVQNLPRWTSCCANQMKTGSFTKVNGKSSSAETKVILLCKTSHT